MVPRWSHSVFLREHLAASRLWQATVMRQCLKLKENPELWSEQAYVRLNVEKYGGMICSTWFDRPLSVAGRLLVKSEEGVTVKLVQIDKDLLMLPSLAIHMNRDINTGYDYHAQKDMLPLYGMGTKGEKESFMGSDCP